GEAEADLSVPDIDRHAPLHPLFVAGEHLARQLADLSQIGLTFRRRLSEVFVDGRSLRLNHAEVSGTAPACGNAACAVSGPQVARPASRLAGDRGAMHHP